MAIVVGEVELDRIQHLDVDEKQTVVEHHIPGSKGNAFQHLGRRPVKITINGLFQGETGLENLEKLRTKFQTGEVLPFSSDAATPAEVSQVIIQNFQMAQVSGKPQYYQYFLILKEVVERPSGAPDTAALDQIDAEAAAEAGQFMENLEAGLENLQGAAKVKELVDRLSPSVKRLSELVGQLKENQ
ncbi:MAG TPA: DUF6046 domain-containing protein [bacterium]|nr:DUF6046 domain-containing protein [bacterium]